jgi:hypothetical protein
MYLECFCITVFLSGLLGLAVWLADEPQLLLRARDLTASKSSAGWQQWLMRSIVYAAVICEHTSQRPSRADIQ